MTARGSDRDWAFTEGPTTAVTRVVAAPIARVWARVSDIGFPVAASPELQRVEWLDGAVEPAVGARFVGHNARGDLTWSVTCAITRFEPPHTIAWSPLYQPDDVDDPEPLATWRFDLAEADGGTRVTQTVTVGPGRSGLTWAIRQQPEREAELIAGRLAQFERAMTANLDELAEEFGHAAGTPSESGS